jgi:hypothetical protein
MKFHRQFHFPEHKERKERVRKGQERMVHKAQEFHKARGRKGRTEQVHRMVRGQALNIYMGSMHTLDNSRDCSSDSQNKFQGHWQRAVASS